MPSPSTFDHAKRISASAIERVESELELTDLELRIAARVGVTREQLLEQKAMDRLEPDELRLMRSGLTAVEVLACRPSNYRREV